MRIKWIKASNAPTILIPIMKFATKLKYIPYQQGSVHGKKNVKRDWWRAMAMIVEDWKWPACMCGYIDRSHLLFITVIHATAGDISVVRAYIGGPGGTTMTRTFVPQLARTRTRTWGRVPRLSFVGVHRVRRFESGHPFPPIRGHAHDTRPRTPGGAFNARSLLSARERAAHRGRGGGVKTHPVVRFTVFLHRPSPVDHPLFAAFDVIPELMSEARHR